MPQSDRPAPYSEYMRAKSAAMYLGIPVSTFYQLVTQGILPKSIKLTERVALYRRSDLEAALTNKTSAESIHAAQTIKGK